MWSFLLVEEDAWRESPSCKWENWPRSGLQASGSFLCLSWLVSGCSSASLTSKNANWSGRTVTSWNQLRLDLSRWTWENSDMTSQQSKWKNHVWSCLNTTEVSEEQRQPSALVCCVIWCSEQNRTQCPSVYYLFFSTLHITGKYKGLFPREYRKFLTVRCTLTYCCECGGCLAQPAELSRARRGWGGGEAERWVRFNIVHMFVRKRFY